MSNSSSTTSSGYNYWSKTGNLASITEQASLIALGNTAYLWPVTLKGCKFADPGFLSCKWNGLKSTIVFLLFQCCTFSADRQFPRTFDKEFTKNCFRTAIVREVLQKAIRLKSHLAIEYFCVCKTLQEVLASYAVYDFSSAASMFNTLPPVSAAVH